MFDVTALLRDKGLAPKRIKAHILFSQHYIKTGIMSVEMGENLAEVFVLRQSSDYDFEFEPDEANILTALEHARTFFAATRAYFEVKH
ncbi:MAG: HEPN domain-containing protein [Lewinellaceae bacterium]|nr:HEPN domain-containing protein [Lewinellaceae bacterium]